MLGLPLLVKYRILFVPLNLLTVPLVEIGAKRGHDGMNENPSKREKTAQAHQVGMLYLSIYLSIYQIGRAHV